MISVCLTPACATADSGNGFLDLFKPYIGDLTNLGENVQGSDFSVETLANCHPRRAAAIRGQVAGKTLVTVSLESGSTFQTVNDYLPLATIYVQDLGLKNLTLPASDWTNGCLSTTTPDPCYSNNLSLEKLPVLGPADAILVQSLVTSSNDVKAFNANPLWRALPQVKSGHLAQAAFFTETGPVCFALDPAGGGKPGGPVTLAAGSAKVTLAASASYSAPETSYQTSPPTSQAAGCAVAPPALAQAMTSTTSSVTLRHHLRDNPRPGSQHPPLHPLRPPPSAASERPLAASCVSACGIATLAEPVCGVA